jgi:3-oxoacyl-[acyl-carrier protein] reductase
MHMTVQTQIEKQSSQKLAGKVALVTGSSRGIGAAIALRLASDGATVAVNYSKTKSGADDVVAQISKAGAKATAFKGSVSSEQEVKKLVDDIVKAYGRIDILVNNAGVAQMKSIEELTLADYDEVFDVNVKGLIATTIAALPHIPNGGRIINLSSIAATGSLPGASVYSASKAALEGLTRIWAQDLGKRQITVNAVAPGATVSDMFRSVVPEEADKEVIARTALGRLGEPKDIADLIAFLASDDARWITGQSIVCNGGHLL